MKTWILILSVVILNSNMAFSEVYLIKDSATNEVYTVSQKDDTVTPDGMELIVLEGTIVALGLSKNPIYYKYIDDNFILNNEKINEEYQAGLDAVDLAEDMELINKKMKEIAFDALKAEGHIFKKITKDKIK